MGHVQFKNVSAKYITKTTPVLSNLDLNVLPGQKIGVVGRTGAGKTSFIKLFWNGLDISEGSITIDGRDISQIDLKYLRKEIMVVSQETALFSGTIRENLDPQLEYLADRSTQEFMDNENKIVRDIVELGFDEKKLDEKGLDYIIEGDGSNLSLGERQIISFERTIIGKKNIIILDEATAAVDLKTEKKIQEMIDKTFKNKTMFIIAHRIQTVMKCDKILVLDLGKVKEFGTIEELLKKPNGQFKSIYEQFKKNM